MNPDANDVARVRVELERDGEPMRGRLWIADRPPREFAGMLELMTLLDSVRLDRIPNVSESRSDPARPIGGTE